MKAWLFALGLVLCCSVRAEQKVPDEEKALGTWHIAGGASNSSSFLEHFKHMKNMLVAIVTKEDANKITITVKIPGEKGCQTMQTDFIRREDGKFWGQQGEAVVTLEEAEFFGDCAIVTMTITTMGMKIRSTVLHSRVAAKDPEIQQKFMDRCKKLGYHDNQIILLEGEVICK